MEATPMARGRGARLTRDERRAHFLDMAAEIITEQGADSVTMEGVAARAGVSKALGYRYFTNRDDLLMALFDREMAILDHRISHAVTTADNFEDGLRAIVCAWLDLIVERGRLLGSLQQSKLIEGPVEQRRMDRQAGIDKFFAHLITSEYDIERDDAMLVAATLVSGSEGAMRIWVNQGWSTTKIAERYVRLCLGAIQALVPSLDATHGPRRRRAVCGLQTLCVRPSPRRRPLDPRPRPG
jgi:AcrR family transcriptional regulator